MAKEKCYLVEEKLEGVHQYFVRATSKAKAMEIIRNSWHLDDPSLATPVWWDVTPSGPLSATIIDDGECGG